MVLENTRSLIILEVSTIVQVILFGDPFDVELIQSIVDKHSLKVIDDAANAFDTQHKRQRELNCGDISTLSYHAQSCSTP